MIKNPIHPIIAVDVTAQCDRVTEYHLNQPHKICVYCNQLIHHFGTLKWYHCITAMRSCNIGLATPE